MTLKGSATLEERTRGEAIPIEHAEILQRAFNVEDVQRLPERELE